MTSDEDARVRTSAPIVPGPGVPLPPPSGSSYPVRRRRPSGPWLLAILVILLLAGGTLTTLLIGRHTDRKATPGSPSSQPAASVSQTAPSSTAATSGPSASASPSATASQLPAPPALLPRGKEAPASAIPWSQVDAGWNLRAWMARSNQNVLVPSTLYLVNPIGGRYRITTLLPNTAVVDWSPDHRRAITVSYLSSGRELAQEIELSTGRRLSSFLLGNRVLRGYAGPGGHSLLISYGGGTQGPNVLERVSTSGVHQLTYPGSAPLIGELDGSTAMYSVGGSVFLISGQRGFAVLSNGGALLRQISAPSCHAGHWWSDRLVVGTCAGQLVLIDIGTGGIRQITKGTPPEYGFGGGWQFSGGILATGVASCGPGGLYTIDSNGRWRPFRYQLPAGTSGQPALRNVYADQATLVTGNCGSPSRSLIGLNLRARTTTVLLGPGLNGGSVLGP